jgi:hypothetical protein
VDIGAASRDELIEIIAAQQAQIETLATRVAALEEENRRLRGGGGKDVPAWVKPNRPKQEQGGAQASRASFCAPPGAARRDSRACDGALPGLWA